MIIQENTPLAQFTTFEIGGNARYFISATDNEELVAALDYAQGHDLPFFILAGGSNTLFSDTDYNGVVIKINLLKKEVDREKQTLWAEAGCSLMDIINETLENGLSGMESMYGIPGSVGGALRGNAGAFGTEIKDLVKEVTAINVSTRQIKVFTLQECAFAYRDSFFKQNKEWVILSGLFNLNIDTDGVARQKAHDTLALRNERQIQNIKSAGSFFMNPKASPEILKAFEDEKNERAREGRVPAGWLIEKAGFKDTCENDVCTGSRSANYIINEGVAEASAVYSFTSKIKDAVLKQTGIELHEEVTLVGF